MRQASSKDHFESLDIKKKNDFVLGGGTVLICQPVLGRYHLGDCYGFL